jgi:transposase
MRDNEFTRILDWPGFRVFRHEIDEDAKTLRLWVRRKRGNRKLICSGFGRKFTEAHDCYQREVRDLPWRKYQTTVIIELYRVCCPQCGVRIEKVPQLPSKAPFSKDFEDAVGLACESASVRQVARQFRLAASTVRAIDLRYLKRWSARRQKDPLVQKGVERFTSASR